MVQQSQQQSNGLQALTRGHARPDVFWPTWLNQHAPSPWRPISRSRHTPPVRLNINGGQLFALLAMSSFLLPVTAACHGVGY